MSALLRSPIKLSLAAATVIGSLYAGSAGATTIDFGSLPQESVDGVTVGDVTFGYTEFGSASPSALFDVDLGTGVTQHIQSPALVGFADGVLTLNFANPVQYISFGAALTTDQPLTPGFSVSLYDAGGTLLNSTDVDTNPLVLFSEGEFSYDGEAASSMAISFDGADANQFALGSVSYTVPEPGSVAILGMGLLVLGATVVARRQA
jgi:hypothetical protein